VYILDRTNGKPLIGIEERPVPQEPRQKTSKTQPYPIGDATVPQCAEPLEGYEKAGCIFEVFWEEPVVIQPSGVGGTNCAPMSYNPDTGSFYVVATVRTSAFVRYGDAFKKGLRYVGGTRSAPIGSPMGGTFTAVGGNTNKIVWLTKTPYRIGNGGGCTTTAGGLVFHGEPDDNMQAYDAKTGELLQQFQTGSSA
jgi:glucose dehydrogenase